MSDDNLRINPKVGNNVETQPVKSENKDAKTGETKSAEIQVGQELANNSGSTTDAEFMVKKSDQQQAEEETNLADIASMAELPEDTQEIARDFEVKRTGAALQRATQDWFNKNGSLSYDFNYSFKHHPAGESFIQDYEYMKNLKFFAQMSKTLPKEEFKKFFSEIIMNSDEYLEFKNEHPDWKFDLSDSGITSDMEAVANYFRQKTIHGNEKIAVTAGNAVSQKAADIKNTEAQFQKLLDNEGFVSYLVDSCVEFFSPIGTSRADVNKTIKAENKNISKLKQAINEKDMMSFFKEYRRITGVNFKIENFVNLTNTENRYRMAIESQRELKIANELEEKNKYNRNYNLTCAKYSIVAPGTASLPSPLIQSLLKLTNNNYSKASEWIRLQTEKLGIENWPQKDKYNALVEHFITYSKTNAQIVMGDKSVEDLENEYAAAIRNAYGNNLPEEKLKDYMETQATAKSWLQTGVMIGCGMFAGPGALAMIVGGMSLLEKSTDKNGLTATDIISTGGEVALTYAGFKIFGAVSNKTMASLSGVLKQHPEQAYQIAARLASQALGGATAGMFSGSVGAVVSGERDISQILLAGGESALSGAMFAVAFGALAEVNEALKTRAKKFKVSYKQLLKVIKDEVPGGKEFLKSLQGQEYTEAGFRKVGEFLKNKIPNDIYFSPTDRVIKKENSGIEFVDETGRLVSTRPETTVTTEKAFEYYYQNRELTDGIKMTKGEQELVRAMLNVANTGRALMQDLNNPQNIKTMPEFMQIGQGQPTTALQQSNPSAREYNANSGRPKTTASEVAAVAQPKAKPQEIKPLSLDTTRVEAQNPEDNKPVEAEDWQEAALLPKETGIKELKYPAFEPLQEALKKHSADLQKFADNPMMQQLKSMKNPDGKDRFSIWGLKALSKMTEEQFKKVSVLFDIKNPDGTFRFDGPDIVEFAALPDVPFKRALELIRNTSFKPFEISLYAKDLSAKQFIAAKERKLFDYNPNLEGLSPFDRVKLIKMANEQFAVFNSLLEQNATNHFTYETMINLAESEYRDMIIDLMKKYPNKTFTLQEVFTIKGAKPKTHTIDKICRGLSDIQIHFVEEVINNPDLQIISSNPYDGLNIKNKNGDELIIKCDEQETFFTLKTQQGDKVTVKQLSKLFDGLYYSEVKSDVTDKTKTAKEAAVELLSRKIKLTSEPEKYDFDSIVKFLTSGKLTGETVFKTDNAVNVGHAKFNLPQGANKVSKGNGSEVSQLDVTAHPNKNAERITYHYPDGTTSVVDFGLGEERYPLQTLLKPNQKGNGMTLRKIIGNEEIRLTSQVNDGIVIIRNDKTQKAITVDLFDIIQAAGAVNKKTILDMKRGKAVEELFKKLSPTTILHILKFKKTYPNAQFPYLADALDSFCAQQEGKNMSIQITLSDIPQVVGHEALHGMSGIRGLLNNERLLAIHAKEAKENTGLVRELSHYAVDGNDKNPQRGLNELVSIMGTFNEYGDELGSRVEATRLAFPETTKAIEEELMKSDIDLINELIEGKESVYTEIPYAPFRSAALVPKSDSPEFSKAQKLQRKIEHITGLQNPEFTPDEMKQRESILGNVNRDLRRLILHSLNHSSILSDAMNGCKTPAEKTAKKEMLIDNEILRLQKEGIDVDVIKNILKEAKSLEELKAKEDVFSMIVYYDRMSVSDKIKALPEILRTVKCKEQAEIMSDIGYISGFDPALFRLVRENFAENYPYLERITTDFYHLPYNNSSGKDIRSIKLNDVTRAHFDRYKKLWNDRVISDVAIIEKITGDDVLYSLYETLSVNAAALGGFDDYNFILNGILTGTIKKSETIVLLSEKPNVLEAMKVRDSIKKYQIGETRRIFKTASAEEISKILKTFPDFDKRKLSSFSKRGIRTVEWLMANLPNHTFEEFENILNSNMPQIEKRHDILRSMPPEAALKFATCSEEEFAAILPILNNRPELLFRKYRFSNANFERALNMSDEEWENFKLPVAKRTTAPINEEEYRRIIAEKLKGEYSPDMSVYRDIEKRRVAATVDWLADTYSKTVRVTGLPQKKAAPKTDTPTTEELLKRLKKKGKVAIEIPNYGGLKPVRKDLGEIKPKDRERLGKSMSTDISLNIGATRAWENSRIARDLIQNFYDGNGYTMEGVTISVVKKGSKYQVKVTGKGIYDYDRVLNFGYGSKTEDSKSAGQYGEGSKIILGNLLYSRGAEHVKYSAGKWELDFTPDKPFKPSDGREKASECEIMQTLTEAKIPQDGTSLEFETNDTGLVQEIIKARDYFYSPENRDFQNLDYENDYFGVKFLPEGEKGNLYIIQRYEVASRYGLDETLPGMTLIFKTKPDDAYLTKINGGQTLSLETGRNRVGIDDSQLQSLISRYAETLSDEEIINMIGHMKDTYTYPSSSDLEPVLSGLIDVAEGRKLKIDFGHDGFVAVSYPISDADNNFAKLMGKRLVVSDMKRIGVPALKELMSNASAKKAPLTKISEIQKKKMILIDEAVKLFSESLGINDCEVINPREASAPRYLYKEIIKDGSAAEAIIDSREYRGHWVKPEHLENNNFFNLVATWLHEISHKVAGDGTQAFNERLAKLENLIVDLAENDANFRKKLSILKNEFEKVSGIPEDEPSFVSEEKIENRIAELLKKALEKGNIQTEPKTTSESEKVINGGGKFTVEEVVDEPPVSTFEQNGKITLSGRIKKTIKKIIQKMGIKRKISKPAFTVPKKVIAPLQIPEKTFEYHSPQGMTHSTSTARVPDHIDYMKELKSKTALTVQMPENPNTAPVKGNASIKPIDREHLGKVINTPLMIDYNSVNEWSVETVARDIFQNFYDGQGGTLDGVKIEMQLVDGKYRIKISGDSEYSYSYMKNIAASTKTGDAMQAGGFGEGAKMAAKTLLARGLIDNISFASGEWKMQFGKEQGVERKDMHMTRTLTENKTRLNGSFVEFETADESLAMAILKAKDYFRHSDNPDFKDFDFENDKFGFKILDQEKKGNLYYGQRYAIKSDGSLDRPLTGIRIVFKESLSSVNSNLRNIANDCDRKGLSGDELEYIAERFAESMTDEELVSSIQKLERFFMLDNPLVDSRSHEDISPERHFVLGLINNAAHRHIKFDTKDVKIATCNMYTPQKDIAELENAGYEFVLGDLCKVGFKSTESIIEEINKVKPLEKTDIEKQKLALLQELLPTANLRLVEKIKSPLPGFYVPKVKNVPSEDCIMIERGYLEKADFDTLYTELRIQEEYSHVDAKWGYNLTYLIGKQLEQATDASYMAQLKAIKAAFEKLCTQERK